MKAGPTLPQPVSLGKTAVLVLWGFGIKCRLDQGHFRAEWGVGLERYQVHLSRVEGRKLRRVILISSDGYISLEALRFITDVGATFTMLDRRGKLNLVCSPTAPSDSRLRRSQSLALGNGTALRISRWLIEQKLQAQSALARDMLNDSLISNRIAMLRAELPSAESISSVRLIESQGASLYWGAWANVPIRWVRKDERRVPAHWKVFGARVSPITHSPRLASNPPNALLNVLYTLLESECRSACVAMGLDPDIGMLHVEVPSRSSLACDVQEPLRASVDAFVLNWLQSEPLRRADFWEDRNANCRITTPLVIKLCQTSDTWRRLVAPVTENLAEELWSSIPKPSSTLARQPIATRLTQRKKREVKGSRVPAVNQPKPEHVCQGCGKTIGHARNNCADCAISAATERLIDAARVGRAVAHSPEARAREASKQRQHAKARASWTPADQPSWLNDKVYSERIQPLISSVSTSVIASRIAVSRWYAGRIRRGHHPHPRHWAALAQLVGVLADLQVQPRQSN